MQIAQNILVATDFSVLASGVVDHAVELAQMLGAQLSVVTVHTDTSALKDSAELLELRQRMAELETRLRPSGRLARTLIDYGDPAETILRVAKALHADMIVMGTNDRRGFSRLAMGSTAPDVLRNSPVPVLILKKAALRAQASH